MTALMSLVLKLIIIYIFNRFSAENQAWDELLLSYQKKMEDISRQLESCELKQAPEESCSYLGTSQAHVLQAKPDYQKILDCQAEVFYCLEGVVSDDINYCTIVLL
ncbi:Kinetochore-associated protein DSN1-like protein, partial [Ophiophagus hannah]